MFDSEMYTCDSVNLSRLMEACKDGFGFSIDDLVLAFIGVCNMAVDYIPFIQIMLAHHFIEERGVDNSEAIGTDDAILYFIKMAQEVKADNATGVKDTATALHSIAQDIAQMFGGSVSD